MFLGKERILESTDLSTLDLQGPFQVLLCSYVFVYCCGVVISTVFPLSYKSSVFVQYHAPLFRERGIQVDPSFVDCFYHSYKLQSDRSLQSYGVQESDMIVLHDRRFSGGSWMQVVEGLRERIAELEKKVDEDEETIALLSSQLQQSGVSSYNPHPHRETSQQRDTSQIARRKKQEEKRKETKPSCLSNPTTF